MQCFLGCSSLLLYVLSAINGLITQRSVVQIHPPQPFTDLRDYRRSPQFQNHWIAAVWGLKFFRETSFALSFSCFLIAGGNIRSATRLLARRLVFSNAEP